MWLLKFTESVFNKLGGLKWRSARIGKGRVRSSFKDIPLCPPQGSHVTHVWEDLVSQRFFSRTFWRSKAVSIGMLWMWWMVEHTSCLQVQWADFMGLDSRWCRIIMICNVKYRVQAWRAFHIEWGTRECSQGALNANIWAMVHAFNINQVREYQS